jgi:hypothetical protein
MRPFRPNARPMLLGCVPPERTAYIASGGDRSMFGTNP